MSMMEEGMSEVGNVPDHLQGAQFSKGKSVSVFSPQHPINAGLDPSHPRIKLLTAHENLSNIAQVAKGRTGGGYKPASPAEEASANMSAGLNPPVQPSSLFS